MRRHVPALAFAMATALLQATADGQPKSIDVDGLLARVSERVERYYERAQSIMSTESVAIQPLGLNLSPEGFARRLVYDLRIAWEAAIGPGTLPDATVVRELIKANGRDARPGDRPKCLDPKPVSPEPLSMLLPAHRGEFAFSAAGSARIDGRAATLIDFRSISNETPEVIWKDDCVSVSLPGKTRGRLWIDVASGDVLRIDERLSGQFEFAVPRDKRHVFSEPFMAVERADSSIRYQPVAFHDPEETLLLPTTIESLTVFRNAGTPRVRTTTKLSNYRRFLTDSHILQ